jgi:hypothetical protein
MLNLKDDVWHKQEHNTDETCHQGPTLKRRAIHEECNREKQYEECSAHVDLHENAQEE